MVAVQ